MKVTEFSEKTKVDHVSPPWEKYLGENDFISYLPSYQGGGMLDSFEEFHAPADDVGAITCYLYDPVKNSSLSREKSAPLLVFLHGATNALDGKKCVSHSGAEMFATPEYQQRMGGAAFVLVPLANERKDENGMLCDSWSEKYFPHLRAIIERVKREHDISKVIVAGGSSGGFMTWGMAVTYPGLFDGCIPVSSDFMPTIPQLKTLEQHGMRVLYACGKHDEFGCYKEENAAVYSYIAGMNGGICYTPEWTRNGDHGVASLFFGIEMGQHCMITQVQADLMFDDGTPYCEQLPNGITGWIRDVCS